MYSKFYPALAQVSLLVAMSIENNVYQVSLLVAMYIENNIYQVSLLVAMSIENNWLTNGQPFFF